MRFHWTPGVFLSLALWGGAAIRLHAEPPRIYALHDARIARVSGPVIERGTVVIRDGLIESVGENVTVPPDAWAIDCKGLTVTPGLIDALSGWGVPAAPGGNPQAAPPPARGPEDRPSNAAWVKAADLVNPADRVLETVRSAGFTSAAIFPQGNIFSGQGSLLNLAGDRAGQMVVADSVAELVALRTSNGRGYPGSLMGSIAYVRQIYLDAAHYQQAKSIYEKHPEGLQRPGYDRALEGVLQPPLVLLPGSTSIEIGRMVSLAKELKLPAVIYGGHESWRAADLLKQANLPVLLSLKYPEKARDADPAADEPVRVLEYREKAPSSAGALAKAGVKFAFYSDGVTNPKDLMRALRRAVGAGLTADAALRALTLTPAEIYGVASRLGSIDRGKIANLVVADGDLWAEKTKIKYVFVDGKQFEPLPDEPSPRQGRGTVQ